MKRIFLILLCVGACIGARGKEVTNEGVNELTSEGVNELTSEGVNGLRDEGVNELTSEPKETKGMLFFFRIGDKIDRFLLNGVDTSYIGLPEHSWHVAFNSGMVGVHSTFSSTQDNTELRLINHTSPSVDLGFNAGYRGFGIGYSWDALNAYTGRLHFSIGSKSIGVDLATQTSTNIRTDLYSDGHLIKDIAKNKVSITNTSLSLWYALNAAHYSHQAAVKQSYIQKKTAGSLLLHLSYLASTVELADTASASKLPVLPVLMSNVTAVRTRQVAVGVGYGINYTPNNGKVLLHASASALLVAYSVNHISFYLQDSIAEQLPDNPQYPLRPSFPVHVTGNMRAAVSWEINPLVHLNALATVQNIRFKSGVTAEDNIIRLDNWDWKVQLSVGVRFGAGKERVSRAMAAERQRRAHLHDGTRNHNPSIPEWIRGYFWSPRE